MMEDAQIERDLRLELTTALANNEILSANVETLRALSLQLAVQVEELTIQLKTSRCEIESSALRSKRDASLEVEAVRKECAQRTSALRDALEREEVALRETIAMWEDREAAAERRIVALEHEKDKVIARLSHEVDVLRRGIPKVGVQRQGIAGGVGVPSPSIGRRQATSGGGASAISNVLSLTVGLPSADVEWLRVPDAFPQQDDAKHPLRFQTEIVADPTIVEAIDSISTGREPSKDQWVFRLPTGEQLMLSLKVL